MDLLIRPFCKKISAINLHLRSSSPKDCAWVKVDHVSSSDDEESYSDPEWVVLKPPKSQEQRPRKRARSPKSKTIDPPFPWATNHRATVHTIQYLLARGIERIRGEVQCKHCGHRQEIAYDLCRKFTEISNEIAVQRHTKRDHAPPEWMNPRLPLCRSCMQAGSMQPVIAPKNRNINWLFMFLGQTLGCCTLEQLKYFCKHTKNHRTGAKDCLLYLTYLTIYKQLDPDELFNQS